MRDVRRTKGGARRSVLITLRRRVGISSAPRLTAALERFRARPRAAFARIRKGIARIRFEFDAARARLPLASQMPLLYHSFHRGALWCSRRISRCSAGG